MFDGISLMYFCSVPFLSTYSADFVATYNTIVRCGWSGFQRCWGWGARLPMLPPPRKAWLYRPPSKAILMGRHMRKMANAG